jgi:hypothetical protein
MLAKVYRATSERSWAAIHPLSQSSFDWSVDQSQVIYWFLLAVGYALLLSFVFIAADESTLSFVYGTLLWRCYSGLQRALDTLAITPSVR